MTDEQKKMLLKTQQGELDAVKLYQRLAEIVKHEKGKNLFLEVAADEGKHAKLLKSYTNTVLKPRGIKASVVVFLYRLIGHNFVMGLLQKGELKSINVYQGLVDDFPKIQEIIDDEARHAEIAKSLLI